MAEFLTQFWIDFSDPKNLVGHVSYVLLITSMMMRNMNWLRFFAILAGSISSVYYWMLSDMVSMFWEAMFTLVNLGQFLILQIENRRGKFSEEETMFIKTCLPDVERAHARRLVKIGAWTEVQEGSILVTQDTIPQSLQFIVSGSARVIRNEKEIGLVKTGDFVGEMSYLTKNAASATVITSEATRYLAFDRLGLNEHLERHPEVRQAFEASFNRNLVDKLAKANAQNLVTESR